MQEPKRDIKRLFSALINSKGQYEAEDILLLENLLAKFPYSQPLHVLYADILQEDKSKFEIYLPKAAVSVPKREVLFDIINKPEKFWTDTEAPVAYSQTNRESTVFSENIELEEVDSLITQEHLFTEVGEAEVELNNDISLEVLVTEKGDDYRHLVFLTSKDLTFVAPEMAGAETVITIQSETGPDFAEREAEPICVGVETIAEEPVEVVEEKQVSDNSTNEHHIETVIPDFEIPFFFDNYSKAVHEKESGEGLLSKEENRGGKVVFDNIASADYFVFDNSLVDPLKNKAVQAEPIIEPAEVVKDPPAPEVKTHDVSKYHDDKLPFTFLWWLQKTRKEHGINYQPYAVAKISLRPRPHRNVIDKLNHQIIENIFNHQIPLEEPKPEDNNQEIKRKEEGLIEKFIKDEPQIRAPRSEKLDTENKARKSAEDNLDLVSETLAHIYIDQMLFHKAIDTYKKLSLKYPEKSTYFAGQISDLEKKTV